MYELPITMVCDYQYKDKLFQLHIPLQTHNKLIKETHGSDRRVKKKNQKTSQRVLQCAVKLVCDQGYVKSSHRFQPTPPAPAVPISQALLLHRDQWGC